MALPTALPMELSLHVMSFLALPDRLSLRASSKALRTLASLPEGWAALAQTMWQAVQRHGSPMEADESSRASGPGFHGSSVVPACVHGATLIDCCARMVQWPSRISHSALIAYSGNGTAAMVAARVDDDHPTQLTFASVDYGAAPLSTLGVADTPFPHQHAAGPQRPPTPRNPLPFATRAAALGAPKSWALRLTAHYEATLISNLGSSHEADVASGGDSGGGDSGGGNGGGHGGSSNQFSIGLVDAHFVESIEQRAVQLQQQQEQQQQQREQDGQQQQQTHTHTQADTPGGPPPSAPAFGHLGTHELEGLFQSASSAVIRPEAACIFLEQTTAADEETGSFRPAGHGTAAAATEVALVVIASGRRRRHVLGGSRGAVGTPSSHRGTAATPLLVLKPNDSIGCGIDYINGVAYFAHNGARIAGAEVPIDLTVQWRAAIASRGAAHRLRANFGNGSEAFGFDVLSHEARLWHDLHGRYALKELQKRNVMPSASFLAAFPNLRVGGASGSAETHGSRAKTPAASSGGLPSAPPASSASPSSSHPGSQPLGSHASAIASMAAAVASLEDPANADEQPSWAHVVESYLEPWLVRQLDAAARAAQQGALADRPRRAARAAAHQATRAAAAADAADVTDPGGAPQGGGAAADGGGAAAEREEFEDGWGAEGEYYDGAPSSSRLAVLLSALLPAEEVEACALRLLAHGVTVRDVLSRVWPDGPHAAAKPSPAGLGSLLRLAGYALGPRQRLVSRMQAGPPPKLPSALRRSPPTGEQEASSAAAPKGGLAHATVSAATRAPPMPRGEPFYRPPAAAAHAPASTPPAPRSHGFVDFRVSVTDPHRIGEECFLIVHSRLLEWGQRGWTATLRPTDDAAELRWRPPQPLSAPGGRLGGSASGHGSGARASASAGAGAGAGAGGGGAPTYGGGPIAEASGVGSRVFVGSWGGHVPDFRRQPVPVGEHTFVLALSGKEDNYGGWLRALHKEARLPDATVTIRPGETTVVELRLTIGDPMTGPPTRIEG